LWSHYFDPRRGRVIVKPDKRKLQEENVPLNPSPCFSHPLQQKVTLVFLPFQFHFFFFLFNFTLQFLLHFFSSLMLFLFDRRDFVVFFHLLLELDSDVMKSPRLGANCIWVEELGHILIELVVVKFIAYLQEKNKEKKVFGKLKLA